MADFPIPPAIARIAPDGNLTPRQKRRFLIDMSLRKQKPGTGSSLDFLRRRTADISWPDLREALHDIPWAVVGAVATRAYMPEQMTRGLDILVGSDTGEIVIARLKAKGYRVKDALSISGYSLLSTEGVEVKVIFGDQAWLREAFAHLHSDPAGYPVLSLPYLVLMKLHAPRVSDRADIPRMLGLASDLQIHQVREVIARFSPEDGADVEAYIVLGRREISPDGKVN